MRRWKLILLRGIAEKMGFEGFVSTVIYHYPTPYLVIFGEAAAPKTRFGTSASFLLTFQMKKPSGGPY